MCGDQEEGEGAGEHVRVGWPLTPPGDTWAGAEGSYVVLER